MTKTKSTKTARKTAAPRTAKAPPACPLDDAAVAKLRDVYKLAEDFEERADAIIVSWVKEEVARLATFRTSLVLAAYHDADHTRGGQLGHMFRAAEEKLIDILKTYEGRRYGESGGLSLVDSAAESAALEILERTAEGPWDRLARYAEGEV